MSWLDRLERRFGAWAVPQLPLLIVAANGAIYLMSMAQPGFYSRLLLDPLAMRHGEWWRAVTFLFVPPAIGPLWMVFWLYILYVYAQALEAEWGEFKFSLFYLIGGLAMVAAAWSTGVPLSNLPLNTTLFLAFAALFPEFELLLFFFIPVKVKYLAWFTWAVVAWSFAAGGPSARVGIAASLVNYALFFGPQHWEALRLKWEVRRARKRFRDRPPEA